jgi:hypothetical protein
MGEGNENLVSSSPWDFKSSFTSRKMLRHGTSGFTSHPKEGVLRNFIALKNASPWPGSKPQPFGPVESTLITTPPRRLSVDNTVSEWLWIGKNLVGSLDGLILRYYPGIRLKGLRKPVKKPQSRYPVAMAENRCRKLPNTKQECQPLNHDVR